MASPRGILGAFLLNGTGVLDAKGSAMVGLAFNALGKAVRGLPIWYHVVVLDPAAPKGITVVAEPYVIKLE